MDRRVAELLEELHSDDAGRRDAARESLAAMGDTARHAVLGSLASEDERLRVGAIALASRWAAGSPEVARSILQAVRSDRRVFSDPDNATAVHDAVADLGESLDALVPEILRDLASGQGEAHVRAAWDLEALTGLLGPPESVPADSLLDALVAALGDDCTAVRGQAALALGNLVLQPGRTVPALVPLLSDPSPYVRHVAAHALQNFREDAGEAVAALVAQTRDPVPAVAGQALRTLGAVGLAVGEVIDAVRAQLRHVEPGVRMAAAAALPAFGRGAQLAIPDLKAAEKDPDEDVRRAAAWAAERIKMMG
jgi:HEAT repeat protein